MSKFYRINQNIKSPEVRVIDHTGAQVGVMKLEEAIEKARSLEMDVVEVASQANPPVVKIVDFTKFRYQENKKQRAGQKSQPDTKEVRFSPYMEDNDIANRTNRVKEFLDTGNRVKLVVKFSGREITHKEFGLKVLETVLERLNDVSTMVEAPKFIGKLLIAQIKPKK